MQVLDNNKENWLITTDDGSTTTKTKSSDLNKLLYGQGLWGLLNTGDEIWVNEGSEDEPEITIIPDDNAEKYTISPGVGQDLILGKHHKTDLVSAIQKVYEQSDGESVAPIMELYDDIRENTVRQEVISEFFPVFTDKAEEEDDGWFVHGHLLITYEGEFYHPKTTSRERSGSVITENASMQAYGLDIGEITEDIQRQMTIGGKQYRLTEQEIDFLAKVIWAVENTPDRREQ